MRKHMFRDFDHWKRFSVSPLFTQLGEGYREKSGGNKVVAITYYGERHVTSNKPINKPEDMHDWSRGCHDWSRCHWPNIWYGSIGVGSVEPDVKVAWSFADYRQGIDTVLQRALQQ